MTLIDYLIVQLERSTKSIPIDSIAEAYVTCEKGVGKNSIDYSQEVDRCIKEIKRLVAHRNDLLERDGKSSPFLVKGNSQNMLLAGTTLQLLKRSAILLAEDPHEFSNRLGSSLLKRMGCKEENIHVTRDSGDEGIDYWGELLIEGVASQRSLKIAVIGQVKRLHGSTPIEDLREFIGAAQTSLISGVLAKHNYSLTSPRILQFVTTGELTPAGLALVEANKMQVISRRHLAEMGLLEN